MSAIRQRWPLRDGAITLLIETDEPIPYTDWVRIGLVVEAIERLVEVLEDQTEPGVDR